MKINTKILGKTTRTLRLGNASTARTRLTVCSILLFTAASRAEFPATITTTDGQSYNGVTLVRTEPDGFVVNYVPVKDGIGMAKIKFSRLSPDLQKQAGYDEDKARKFETELAKAADDWRAETLRWDQAAKAEKTAQQARDQQEAQLTIERLNAIVALEQAHAGQSAQGELNYGWSSLAGGYGAIAIPEVRNNQAPGFFGGSSSNSNRSVSRGNSQWGTFPGQRSSGTSLK